MKFFPGYVLMKPIKTHSAGSTHFLVITVLQSNALKKMHKLDCFSAFPHFAFIVPSHKLTSC